MYFEPIYLFFQIYTFRLWICKEHYPSITHIRMRICDTCTFWKMHKKVAMQDRVQVNVQKFEFKDIGDDGNGLTAKALRMNSHIAGTARIHVDCLWFAQTTTQPFLAFDDWMVPFINAQFAANLEEWRSALLSDGRLTIGSFASSSMGFSVLTNRLVD